MRLLLLILLSVACARQDDAPAGKGPPKMKAVDMDRAIELCDRWVARICACAEKDQALKERCELARSQPAGVKMHVALLKGARGPLNDEERRISEGNVRDFQQACLDEDLSLDVASCPRPPAD